LFFPAPYPPASVVPRPLRAMKAAFDAEP
jgi:hypothetical protein